MTLSPNVFGTTQVARTTDALADLKRRVAALERQASSDLGAAAAGNTGTLAQNVITTITGGEVWDSSGSIYNAGTGVYTAPRDGTYMVSGWVQHQNASANTSGEIFYNAGFGGGNVSLGKVFSTTAAGYPSGGSSAIIHLNAGDTVTFAVSQSDGTARALGWRTSVAWMGT